MKKFTAVMAVVMVLSAVLITATPASAAPQVPAKAPAAAVMGLLERVMQLLGLRTASQIPVNGSPAPTTRTDEVIWGGSGRGCGGIRPC